MLLVIVVFLRQPLLYFFLLLINSSNLKSCSVSLQFKPGATDDFDISYVLTFIRTDPHKVVKESSTINATTIQRRLFSSMACVFVVAAAGPAMPDVRAEPYNGAVCMWNRVDGIGENYYLDFN